MVLTARCFMGRSVWQLPAIPPSARDIIGSLYALQFPIHSTFVLVMFM